MPSGATYGPNAVADLLAWALRVGLAREAGLSAAGYPPRVPERESIAFVEATVRHRVVACVLPLLADLGLPDSQMAELRRVHAATVRASMPIQAATAHVTAHLLDRGVRVLAFKGVALAERTTGDPAGRGAGDVDLLVDPRDMPAVHAALVDLGADLVPGWTPPPGDALWPFAARVRPEAPYRWRDVDLDVHWRLDPLPQVMSMPFDLLWERRQEADVGGRAVPTLGPLDALLATAAHGTKEHWRQWRWVVDLVRQARQLPERDWRLVLPEAQRYGAERSLAIGLAVGELLTPGLSPLRPGPWARRLANEAWDRGALDSSPFGIVTPRKQLARRFWTVRTRPDNMALVSTLAQSAWSTQDMAQVPLPPAMVGLYPILRPILWRRRLPKTAGN